MVEGLSQGMIQMVVGAANGILVHPKHFFLKIVMCVRRACLNE
jgi:hypothetical protein